MPRQWDCMWRPWTWGRKRRHWHESSEPRLRSMPRHKIRPPKFRNKLGGAHGVLVTAVSTMAFKQAIGMLRRGGTCVFNGLPPGEFPVSIFDLVLNGYTLRGSIVGTRLDLEEALSFAAEGKVKAIIETQPLESINDVFQRLKTGKVNGRVVLAIGA